MGGRSRGSGAGKESEYENGESDCQDDEVREVREVREGGRIQNDGDE